MFSVSELEAGWERVRDNEGCAGVDGLTIAQFAPSAGKRPVLAQLSKERTDEHFPMLVYEGETFGDFKLTTQFKIADGKDEQMAGIAFRIQDEKNY